MASNQTELTALKKLLSQTDLILSTTELSQNSTARCRGLLRSALALTDDLISQAKLPAGAILERKGGSVTAKRGSAYFRKLAARRKTHGGAGPAKIRITSLPLRFGKEFRKQNGATRYK